MNIPMPEGFEMPDNAKPGEPFEVVATIIAGKDGSFKLTAIDGAALPEDEPNEEKPGQPEEDKNGEEDGMEDEMGGGYKMPGDADTLARLMAAKG